MTKKKTTKTTAADTLAVATSTSEPATTATRGRKATKRAPKAKGTKPAKKAGKPTASKKAAPIATTKEAKGPSKKDAVLAMIQRPDGATLEEIMATMNWQRHTVRGFISILGKAGTKIESSKSEAGARTYKAA